MSRRKPRLYAFAPEVELGWFTDVTPGTSDFAALAAAVRAFAEVCANRELTVAQRSALVRAAVHPHVTVRGLGIMRLAVLSHYFPEAGEDLAALVGHADEDVRMWAVGALANAPPALALPSLARGLGDPAWSVRKAAAQVLAAIPMRGALCEVDNALVTERDARVRVVLGLAVELQSRAASSVDDG